jgi:transcriptional regulator with XRE-family HTH domain
MSRGLLMVLETFSRRLRESRLHMGLTQKALGDRIGLSLQAINDLERGRRSTVIEKAAFLADALNTSLDYLTGRSDDPIRRAPSGSAEAVEDAMVSNEVALHLTIKCLDYAFAHPQEMDQILTPQEGDKNVDPEKLARFAATLYKTVLHEAFVDDGSE